MNKLITTLTFTVALTFTSIASADVESSQLTGGEVRITYTADDTNTSYGRSELERQVRRAAEKVCGVQTLTRTGPVRQIIESRNCYKKAVADAFAKLNMED